MLHGGGELAVFEGFFSFLSYLVIAKKTEQKGDQNSFVVSSDFLVLNSLSFMEKSRSKMESYASINLFLDRDNAGMKATEQGLSWSKKFQDKSTFYKGHKDLNEFLTQHGISQLKQHPGRGRHF